MKRHALLILAALACTAAAAPAKAPPSKAPAKPAAAAPAAKAPAAKAAPAPKSAAPAGPFDAQNPQSLIELLTLAGARAQTGRKDEDSVFVTVTSTASNFSVQFVGCDRQGRKCQAAVFDDMEAGAPTLAQINGFNQASATCRVYLDKSPKAHVLYSALLLKTDTRDSAMTHLAAWQGCIVEGRAFLADPVRYLAEAA
jgi:hypothetical protein